MSDRIINFYEELNINKDKKLPKHFKRHYIHHNSHILVIGKTGSGKSNFVLNYLARSAGEFSKIIIFTASTLDEPLYNAIRESSNKVEAYDNIDEMPNLEELEEKNMYKKPKLIIFDDFLILSPKELKKVYKYIVSSRKYGCSCILMSQDYKGVNKLIVRNVNYIILFKINDNISINNILKNHNIIDVDKDVFKRAFMLCTHLPLDFMCLDFRSENPIHRIRHNFLDFLCLTKKENNLMLENDEK